MSCKALERREQFDHQGMNFLFPDSIKKVQTSFNDFDPHDRKQHTSLPPESVVSSTHEKPTFAILTNPRNTSTNTAYADLDDAFGKSEEMERFENKIGNAGIRFVTPTQMTNDLNNINAKLEEISKDYDHEVDLARPKIKTYPHQIPPQTIFHSDPLPLWNRPHFRRIGASSDIAGERAVSFSSRGASELLEPYGISSLSDTIEYYTGMSLYKWGLLIILIVMLFAVIYCVSHHMESPSHSVTVSTSSDSIRKNLLSLQNQIRNLVMN